MNNDVLLVAFFGGMIAGASMTMLIATIINYALNKINKRDSH